MTLTCLQCGHQRRREDTTLQMNERARRPCEGRCKTETHHIAGLPKNYVHLSNIEHIPVGKRTRKKK
jgi:hypothetical protein